MKDANWRAGRFPLRIKKRSTKLVESCRVCFRKKTPTQYIYTYMHTSNRKRRTRTYLLITYRKTYLLSEGHTNRRMHRQKDIHTEGHTNRETGIHKDGWIDRQTNAYTQKIIRKEIQKDIFIHGCIHTHAGSRRQIHIV